MKLHGRRTFLTGAAVSTAGVVAAPWMSGSASASTSAATLTGRVTSLEQRLRVLDRASNQLSTTGTPLKYGASGAYATTIFLPAAMTGPAIQTAIDKAYAAGGGVVKLVAGTYLSNVHLVVKSNVSLVGVGPATIIKAGPSFITGGTLAGGYPVISTNGHSNVTIKSLTADQSGDVLNGNVGGRLSAYLVEARNSRNVMIDGVYTRNPFTYSICSISSTMVAIRNCNTLCTSVGRYNQLDGIHIAQSAQVDVVDNVVNQGGKLADGDDGLVAHVLNSACHDCVYRNNDVTSGKNGTGMQLAGGSAAEIYNIVVQNNHFHDSPAGIHTGYYGGGTMKAIHNILIGGSSSTGNTFSNCGSYAVKFGTGGPLSYCVVTYNNAVNSGAFSVAAGSNNVKSNNTVS
jgi:polygalacturonase